MFTGGTGKYIVKGVVHELPFFPLDSTYSLSVVIIILCTEYFSLNQ